MFINPNTIEAVKLTYKDRYSVKNLLNSDNDIRICVSKYPSGYQVLDGCWIISMPAHYFVNKYLYGDDPQIAIDTELDVTSRHEVFDILNKFMNPYNLIIEFILVSFNFRIKQYIQIEIVINETSIDIFLI